MRSVGLLAAGAATVALLLAGCSEDGEAEPRKPDSSSAAATPTPTPTGPVEPTLPPEAQGEDAAAAEAFVKHFWAMVNYAQETGDVAGLTRLASERCVACAGGAESITEVREGGGSSRGGAITVMSTSSGPFKAGPVEGFIVNVRAHIEPQVVRFPGKKPERYSGGPARFQVIVERIEGGWRIGRWDDR